MSQSGSISGGGGGTASPLTSKGDVYTYSTVDARLGVGADGEVLTADAAEVTGLKWAAASTEFIDNVFRVLDDGDDSKKLAFECSGITTATTRTLTVPDASGTIALTSDAPQFLNGYPILKLSDGFEYFTHCLENMSNGTTFPFARSILGGADMDNTVNRPGTNATHPGQYRFYIGNDAASRAGIQTGSGRDLVLGGGEWVFEAVFNFAVLSSAGNEYLFEIGLTDARNGDVVANGVFFEYDRTNSVNYIAVTESAGVRTEIDSGIAVSTSSTVWPKVKFVVNAAATSVEFFLDDVSIGTSTTNIPTASMQMFGRIGKSSSTGAGNYFYLDYIYYRNELTTSI